MSKRARHPADTANVQRFSSVNAMMQTTRRLKILSCLLAHGVVVSARTQISLSVVQCGGWVNKHKACQGSQHESFEGYVVLPLKKMVIRPEAMNSSKLRSSIGRAAQIAKMKTIHGVVTPEASKAQRKLHDKRRRIIDDVKQAWKDA